MLKDHEKLLAFGMLGAGVLIIVFISVVWPPENDQIIRILDTAVGGFLLALGSAANALFRISEDKALNKLVDKQRPLTGEAAAVEAARNSDEESIFGRHG